MIPAYLLCGTTFPHPPLYRSCPGSGEPRFAGLERFFSREPVFLIPLAETVRSGSQEIRLAGGVAFRFRRNHFSSFLLGGTGAQESQKIRLAGGLNFFSREPLSLILSGRDGRSGPVDRRRREHRVFFKGNHFSLFPLFAGNAIDRTPTISGRTPSSSSRQGDSEILAVRKTGAWVLRLLPPTS